jgi:hypothetical protein
MSISQWEKKSSSQLGNTYRSIDNSYLFIVPNPPIPIEHLAQSWQDVNHEEARIFVDSELGQGIIVPHHLPVTRPSLNENITEILNTYLRTGRILLDKNLDLFRDASGQIYTNHVFLALNLTDRHFEINKTDRELYESIVNNPIFNKNNLDYIKCTLKALMVISQYRPDINDLSFLKHNLSAILKISYGYHPEYPEMLKNALKELQLYSPEDVELCTVKNNCIEILGLYKASKENELFISSSNTRQKILVLDELIENIKSSHFLEDIIKTLQTFLPANRDLMHNPHHHGGLFRQVIKQCLEIPQFKVISNIYTLKEECIALLEDYQHSKNTLAWAKSFYSKSQSKILELDHLIDKILQSKTPVEISRCLEEFKENNKDLFKKQTGELMISLENCEYKIQEHIANHEHASAADTIFGKK